MKKYILPKKLQRKVHAAPETGMGWSCIRVILKDGRVFKNVVVLNDSEISDVYGYGTIPFKVNDINDVIVTHTKDYPKNFKGFHHYKL